MRIFYNENYILFYNFNNLLFKPSIMGLIFYVMYRIKAKTKFGVIEYILGLSLVYQLGLLTEILLNSYFNQFELFQYIDYSMNMADNNSNQNNDNNNNRPPYNLYPPTTGMTNIPRQDNDYTNMVRVIAVNAAAWAAKTPRTRAVNLVLGNTYAALTDILTNPEKANYWIDQWNHYKNTGSLRGGKPGYGPFEREFNPFDPGNNGSSGGSGVSSLIDSSNSSDKNFFQNLLSPVDHSIPLETLINQHFIITLLLFILVLALIFLVIFFYLDLIILFNKDYFLNKVNNKYILMYVKYVVFKYKINLVVIAGINLFTLFFLAYCLHYLITHPIVLNI